MNPDIICMVVVMSIIGSMIGTVSGLLPGIHVNTLSAMLLASYPLLEGILGDLVPYGSSGIAVSSCIISASIVHSFVDYVPSVFIGVPDPDDVVSMLPGHRLMNEGLGMLAVRSAAIGSCVGALVSIALSVPLQYLLLNGLSEQLDEVTWLILVVVICLMIMHEPDARGMIWAAICIAVSGVLGLICMDADIPANGPLMEGTMLFPLLTGLFGVPAMLDSLNNDRYVEQRDDIKRPVGIVPGIKGVLTGTLTGWFPGITSTTGAVISNKVTPERSAEGFISMTASIGTAAAVMMLTTMSVTGSGRSGATIIVAEILGDAIVGPMNENYLLLLVSAAVASVLGYYITISCGKAVSSLSSKVNAKLLNGVCLVMMTVLIFLLTGPYGILILVVAAVAGYLPIKAGVSRIHLTGCLIVPTALSYLGLRDAVLSLLF